MGLALMLPFAAPPAMQLQAPVNPDAPTSREAAAGSALAYAACGLPPLAIAGLAAMYGWTAPVVVAFAAGGAALSMFESQEGTRAEAVPPILHATAGAVRGALFFPAMTGYAGKNAWGPIMAQQIQHFRQRRSS